MKKMILMAIAGYFWKKFQARTLNPSAARRTMRRG